MVWTRKHGKAFTCRYTPSAWMIRRSCIASSAFQSALVIGLVAVTAFGPWGGASGAQGTDAGRPMYRAGDVPLPEEAVLAVRSYGRDHHYYLNFGLSTSDCGKKSRWWYGSEGRLCVLDLRTGALRTLVDDPGGCVRDPQVHYDGRRILFSWRKAGSHRFHLFEIDSGGGNLRQLTDGDFDDIEPTYTPDGGIFFVSTRCNRAVPCHVSQVADN